MRSLVVLLIVMGTLQWAGAQQPATPDSMFNFLRDWQKQMDQFFKLAPGPADRPYFRWDTTIVRQFGLPNGPDSLGFGSELFPPGFQSLMNDFFQRFQGLDEGFFEPFAFPGMPGQPAEPPKPRSGQPERQPATPQKSKKKVYTL